MNYSKVQEYLNSLRAFGVRLGLDRVNRLLARLYDPHKNLSCVVVGGTNGKGSVASMLSSVLVEGGFRTGLYTSPHLLSFNERIRVDGREIDDSVLAKYVEEIRPLVSEVSVELGQPTYFEVATAIALKYFSDEKTDYCVLEVGLGGRLDATNVADPVVSVLTSIGMDHTVFLGDSITEVASEKAGIIREGRPVVCGELGAEALGVVEDKARGMGSPAYVVGRDVSYKLKNTSPDKTVLDYAGLCFNLSDVELPLVGRFQASNAATALCALEVLVREGVVLSEDVVRRGLLNARWPGRFEVSGGKPTVVLDGAHNPHAFKALSNSLKEVFPDKKIVLVLSVLDYKKAGDILSEALSISPDVVVTQSSHPTTLSAVKLSEFAVERGFNVSTETNPAEALSKAKELAGVDGVVCACGSLFLVADIKKYLGGGR